MLRWSLTGELYSFVILLILFIRYYGYERHIKLSGRRLRFLHCLLISMTTIAINILCVNTLAHTDTVPQWINIALNSTYFLAAIGMCSMFAYLLFDVTLEHVYDKHCLRKATIMLCVVTGISALFVFVNLFTGILFYFDEAGLYQRGPLNQIYYCLPFLELVFLCICFIRNRASVGQRMVYVMLSLPPLILLVSMLQLLYPEILLNGTLSAVVSLVLFIAFQTHTEDWDSLTGTGSRKNFVSELSLRTASRQAIQIIVISLPSLPDVNLQHGHAVGDALLYETARYLRQTFSTGRVFRTSNVTFTLTLPLADAQTADAHLHTIEKRFQDPWVLGEISCQQAVHLAELRSAELTNSAAEVIEQLDYTLALAKETQKTVSFDNAVKAQLEQKNHLIHLLHRSIQEKRFQVWYQPIYCCHDDIFCSAEALLRLYDDENRPVSPELFIPLAEEAGLIDELTWVVLEQVCCLLSETSPDELKTVSINLSMQQLLDPNLAEHIQQYIRTSQISPERLKIEITERFLLHDAQYAKRQLEALAAIGVQIYMDDFGTGYSNLSSVLNYPFAFIKLDRSLVSSLPENDQAGLMFRSLLNLFHGLDKRVVVEGVETAEQASYAKACGADMIQGFYYAKPMPRSELTDFFRSHKTAQ